MESSDSGKGSMATRAAAFLQFYCCQGQLLDAKREAKLEAIDDGSPLLARIYKHHRKKIAMAIPATAIYIIWLGLMMQNDYWYVFKDKYYMSITMVFGSMFAGATSEGGAAIAFPVMTLAFDVSPVVARDFSFMIQSVGMTCAAFTIFCMGVRLEYNALLFCTLGGVLGLYLGLEHIAPEMDPPMKKIFFVCVWFAFAAALYILNRDYGRRSFLEVPAFKPWKGAVLVAAGVAGGIFSAISGSGIDICSFAVLTLLFRVSEKVATPTSVVLMAINTVVGYMFREFYYDAISLEAKEFLYACMPVVCVGAPLGAVLGSNLHRLTLAALVYVVDTVQLLGAFVLVKVKPEHTRTPEKPILLGIGVAIAAGGWLLFMVIAHIGARLAKQYTIEQMEMAGYVEENSQKPEGLGGSEMERSSDNLLFSSGTAQGQGGKLQKKKSSELDLTAMNL